VPLSTYRAQRRGGKGRSGGTMREDDVITQIFVGVTHTPMLFFSNLGQVYRLKLYKLPLGGPQNKGRPIVNLLSLKEGENITTIMPMPEDENLWDDLHIMFSTSKGNVRRNDLSDFKRINVSGKIAIRMDEDDSLVDVRVCSDTDHILLASRAGKCIRFPVSSVRVFKSRTSDGVRGMDLEDSDKVISMTVLRGAEFNSENRDEYLKIPLEIRKQIKNLEDFSEIMTDVGCALEHADIKKMAENEDFILTVSENGYGKCTSAYEYRVTNRGGKGIANMVISEKNGPVISNMPVKDSAELMLITSSGKLIRCEVNSVRVTGRNTMGVILFRTAEGEKVVSAAIVVEASEEAESESDNDESVLL
jgi:DNA gyrase subunit A